MMLRRLACAALLLLPLTAAAQTGPSATYGDLTARSLSATGTVSANRLVGPLTGNASTASALATARTFALSGDVSASAAFDGSGNVTLAATLANSGLTAGTYGSATQVPQVTFDAKGRATGVTLQTITYPVTSVAGRTGAITLTSTDLGDATGVGRSVLTATTAAAARGAIGATASTASTMLDVAKSSNQAIGGTFTRVEFTTVNRDPGSNWNSGGNWYTCPTSGVYLITGVLRVADNTAPGTQVGLGVYTSETDGAGWFGWGKIGPSPASRQSFTYSRISYQAAGDQLRMFSFSDASGGIIVQSAGMQIILLAP